MACEDERRKEAVDMSVGLNLVAVCASRLSVVEAEDPPGRRS